MKFSPVVSILFFATLCAIFIGSGAILESFAWSKDPISTLFVRPFGSFALCAMIWIFIESYVTRTMSSQQR